MNEPLKIRNIFVKEQLEKYLNVRVNNNTIDSPALDASLEYIIYQSALAGGSVVSSIPISDINLRLPSICSYSDHKSTIQDLNFSPFHDKLFATTSDDTTVKLWKIKKRDVNKATSTLTGHTKRVSCSRFNPVADAVIASGSSDNSVIVWNLTCESKLCSTEFTTRIQDLKWNYNGSLLGVTTNDKFLHIIDPRSEDPIMHNIFTHEGIKTTKLEWLGGNICSENYLTVSGHEKGSERSCKLYDIRNISKELAWFSIGKGAGSVYSYWDPSIGLMYMLTRGESLIRVTEINNLAFNLLLVYRCKEFSKAFGFLPKRGLILNQNEIMRCYQADTTTTIQPISFYVASKTSQANRFPPCFARKAVTTATEWFDSKLTYSPNVKKVTDPPDDGCATPPSEDSDEVTDNNVDVIQTEVAHAPPQTAAKSIVKDPYSDEDAKKTQPAFDAFALKNNSSNSSLIKELAETKLLLSSTEQELQNLKSRIQALVPDHIKPADPLTYIEDRLKEYNFIVNTYKKSILDLFEEM